MTRIQERLADYNLRAIARGTGLSYMTVYRAARGVRVKPSTLNRIQEYLDGRPHRVSQ
jgi:DNA invertase Pin-like site-specific DNA recombinase